MDGSRMSTGMQLREPYKNRIELLQGTLDMLILQTLRWGAQHGYGIAQAMRTGSEEVLQVETGSLYPALHRLEKQGWIKSEWRTSEHNQRAKYYQLTAAGKKHLASEHDRWNQLSAAIARLMNPKATESET
jgi:PadR family transcriptional regulator, regulatory protein PadR